MEKKIKYILLAVILLAVVIVVVGLAVGLTHGSACNKDVANFGENTGFYKYGAVASDNEICSQVGTDILARHGGSSVDAAIATLICLGVVNSQHVGIGGGHIMMINEHARNSTKPGKEVKALIARSTAPLWVRPEYFENKPEDKKTGASAISVPCEVRGYYVAWERYGRVPWKQLFQPSIKLANDGWPVSQSMADSIRLSLTEIEDDAALREAYLKEDGKPYEAGEIMTNSKLGRTLKRVAEEGPDTFYTGLLARDIIDDIEDLGGRMSFDDMASNKVLLWSPITTTLRNGSYYLQVAPPPSSGSIVAFILRILDELTWNPHKFRDNDTATAETLHRFIESWGMAFSLRKQAIGDKAFQTRDMIEWLDKFVDEEYAKEVAALITSEHQVNDLAKMKHAKYQELITHGGTTHVNVLAADGGAVSVTSTVGSLFGCKVRGNRTGIIFNNDLNLFDLPSETMLAVNYMYPRKRGRSSTSPIMILDDEKRVVMLAGSSGGTRIITSTSSVIAHALFEAKTATEAVALPRVHAVFNSTLYYDKGVSRAVLDKLRAMGHEEQVPVEDKYPYLGVHQMIDNRACLQCGDGCSKACIEAVSDWRKGGKPGGY